MLRLHVPFAGLAMGVLLMAGCASEMERSTSLRADLSGAQEVPPAATSARGSGAMTYNAATKQLNWNISYTGLSGPATAAHFHGPAATGANAGVAVPIGGAGMSSPASGSATLTDVQAADLLAGRWYVNIHTAANPGGEIRGQVMKAQ